MHTDSGFADNVLLFGRVLRAAGVDVHHRRLLDALQALEWIGVGNRHDVRATLRSLLVHRHEDIATFNEAFDLFFQAHRPPAPGPPLFSLGERPRVVAKRTPGSTVNVELDDAGPEASSSATSAVGAWSPQSVSRTKDFAEFTPAELERARLLLEQLSWRFALRRTRRWRRASIGAVNLRSLLRRGVVGDDLVELPRRVRREAGRPLVFLGDVSGSMERYTRMLLHFVYGLTRSRTRVESFLFATTLTRVTRHIAGRRANEAFARVAREVQDWGGGTRIGDALRTFNTRWARRVMRNGPIVLIVSDGWDRGDPELLARELARVRRSCRRLIWLNPLLGSADYRPLTRGMQAALRYVDDFRPAHNLASLEELAAHLGSLGTQARRTYGTQRHLLV